MKRVSNGKNIILNGLITILIEIISTNWLFIKVIMASTILFPYYKLLQMIEINNLKINFTIVSIKLQ